MVTNKPIMVAELSINHLGMVNIAKKMIDEAISCGADLIKLKYKNVDKYYRDDGKVWRNFNFKTYRGSLELSKKDFETIAKYCSSKNIKWFCTVHDDEGLEFLKPFDPPYYKVASMDADNEKLVDRVMSLCKEEDKPLVISLGGKNNNFVSTIVSKVNDYGIKAYLLHTVSIYPTPTGESNMSYVSYLKRHFESDTVKVGYSGHEVGFTPSLLAATQGASMIERHFTLSRDWLIHHMDCALTPTEYKQMTSIIEEMTKESNSKLTDFHQEELSFLKDRNYS